MFEPMPAMMRRERERQGLTLEELSNLAGISRSRLSALERGEENVSMEFVLKVASALGMSEVRVSGLRITAAPPELTVLVAAADAIETARRVVDQATASREQLDRVSGTVATLLDRILTPVPDAGIAAAIERLSSRSEDGRATAAALREAAESPDVQRRAAARPKAAPRSAGRKGQR